MGFQKINNITGWSVFAIATLVYVLTLEETASFWDCGEFIAVSYKMMVPHPPGAPFFILIGRIFSFFAMGDTEQVAYWINMVSVLSSSFTILFLFWTIVLFGRKILKIENLDNVEPWQKYALMAAGVVGSLAYTFSDSFWFSAVEAEVYAMSSFFTAFVVWAIMKWDLIDDDARANRWLILIAYMMGLSIGVHLLNLVTIPALGLIYYFKKYKVTLSGLFFTLLISGSIIILINNIIIPGLPSVAGVFEITFVNTLGLPFWSGALFFSLLLVGAMVWGIMYSMKNGKVILNTALLSLTFILIGYSSYALVVIRSSYNPPIDENNPEDVMSFVRFLKREQYGSRPLFHGQLFTAKVTGTEKGEPVYSKGKEKYEITDHKTSYTYDPAHTALFPRAYSNDPNHIQVYRQVMGLAEGERPSFADNIYYMFKHQIGKMYVRYFMWNFSGRESDIQDAGFLTPFSSSDDIPKSLAENRGRNNYFMIPLLLGFIGVAFQYFKDPKNFLVVGLLFFLTGIALILYLNSPPIEPRERDYIYVGSYYAFAIWIGLSVLAFVDILGKVIKEKSVAVAASFVLCLTAPTIMAQQGWDDHDRSNRFYSVDSAKNFLASCAPNAIILTGGDNDTFPLWYVQEVEGFRTDVRVIVLSYSNTDWYISQMRDKMYESEPFPLTISQSNYQQGGPNDYLLFEDLKINVLDIQRYIQLINENNPNLRSRMYADINVVPSRLMSLNIDRNKVNSLGIIPQSMDSLLVDRMVFSLKGGALEKKDLLLLDLLATNNWERPIYLNNTSRQQLNLNLDKYLVQEGNAYRILPVENPEPSMDLINTDLMYMNLMEKFHYRELDNPNTYYNEDYRNFALNLRSTFSTLVEALINEGKNEKAKTALNFILDKVPDTSIPYDVSAIGQTDLLLKLGERDRALEIAETYGNRINEIIQYDIKNGAMPSGSTMQRNMMILAALQRALVENGENELAQKLDDAYEKNLQLMENYGSTR
ncbi:MAG: DUF2723 domain-containing protein [Cyclobacteriaceae bacterium]|nr:DUF2723 domain-containing protein [Cyclobacteriaceae bacterium]